MVDFKNVKERLFMIHFSSLVKLISVTILVFAINFQSSANSKSEDNKAVILYFNDAHVIYPVIDDNGERGGTARLKTIVSNVKKKNKNVIVLFGGDLAGGVLFGAVFHGFPMVEALNEVPVDIANFGQHDFDFGTKVTKELISKSKFQWITSNLKETDNKPFDGLKEYVIKQIGDMKIGFFGLTDDMDTTGGATNVTQENLFKATEQAVNKLMAEKTDYIIAITQTDRTTGEKLIKKFPNLNAVFTEEASETVSYVSYYHDQLVMTGCGNIGSVISLKLGKNKKGSIESKVNVYSVDSKVKSDPDLKKLEEKYRNELGKKLNKKIAILATPLKSGFTSDNASRFKETNSGDLIADAYRNYYHTDIAFMNGGGIRADILKTGNFTLEDAMSLLPFSNTIGVYQCSGKVLMEALEHGVSGVEKLKGSFLQVSGLTYTYTKNNEVGHRISDVKVDKKPLDLKKEYSAALPSYMFNGGDGFTMFKNCKVLSPPLKWKKDVDILAEYCKKLGTINYSLDGRIIVK